MGKRQFITFIYVFFLTIVIGVFAAIAMNDYGVVLIAIGCFGISFIYILKLYSIYSVEKPRLPKRLLVQEYGLMAIIMTLFGLRALRIRFEFVEWVFILSALMMVYIYIRYFLIMRKEYKMNKELFYGIGFLYISIILFFISLSLTFFNQGATTILGAISFALSLSFIGWYFWTGRTTMFKEESVNILKEVFQYINLSPIILVMILLISTYMGLYQFNMLPPIYTGEIPVRYEDLLDKSIRGETDIIDGKAKHEIYWEEYQKFLNQMEEREKSK